MKKFTLIVVILSVVAVALGSVGVAFAQTGGNGTGWMGGRGSQRGMMGAGPSSSGTGILHDYLIAAYAEELNIPIADLEARLANGETMAQIALSTGLTLDEFRTLMVEVRTSAIDQALADGLLTQAQADWLKSHGGGQMANGRKAGGLGQGQNANLNCPYYNQTVP